jgi:hypothetical protein
VGGLGRRRRSADQGAARRQSAAAAARGQPEWVHEDQCGGVGTAGCGRAAACLASGPRAAASSPAAHGRKEVQRLTSLCSELFHSGSWLLVHQATPPVAAPSCRARGTGARRMQRC